VGDLGVDTAIEGGDGRYTGRVSDDWAIWGPNGGYIAAFALRAAGAHSGLPRPAAFSCHFLSVAAFDTIDIETTSLRASKRAASTRVSISQGGKAVLDAVVWSVAEHNAGLAHDHAEPPDVADHQGLKTIRELVKPGDEPPFPFWNNFDAKPLHWLDREEWMKRTPGAPIWREWLRFLPTATFDDPYVDAARLLILADVASWPSAVQAHPADNGFIAPNLDVNVQFHRDARDEEWLLADGFSAVAEDGLIGFRSQVWSGSRRLLASGSGQLLCRPVG
jgi:acyl-CoA thioesterase